jgi:predicted TIM-barrel fold metal-dependent hydrolase
MGRVPLQKPESAALLPKWREQPGMKGVRVTFLRNATTWLKDGTADWLWAAAEKAGLPIMALAPGQSAAFAPVAERHPGLNLIVDHMNLSIEIAQEHRTLEVAKETAALAKYPNVSCKMSSAPTYSLQGYPFRDMYEPLKCIFEAFGPRRCYWGTDMTNSFAKCTYRQRITHFTEELDFLSEEDKDWVMGRAILERLGWT